MTNLYAQKWPSEPVGETWHDSFSANDRRKKESKFVKGQSSSWENALQSGSSGHLSWTPIWRDRAHVAWLPWGERRATAGVCAVRVGVRDLQYLYSCLAVKHTTSLTQADVMCGSLTPISHFFHLFLSGTSLNITCSAGSKWVFYRNGLRV